MHGQKNWKANEVQEEENTRKAENVEVKVESVNDEEIKEEPNELMEPMEPENMTQHSDILTSLQMIPVVRKSTDTPVIEESVAEEPIETSKIIAAMREAMLVAEEMIESKPAQKVEKKRRVKRELKELTDGKTRRPDSTINTTNAGTEKMIIICNGCGMQFDSSSACQRHKKKCVYWKEDKNNAGNKTNRCVHCDAVFPYLMALLKHSCMKADAADEPAMPELCPEGLVESVQGNSVEDIPILSPAEVIRDDEHAKRLSHIEATVNQVGTESFDVTGYYDQFMRHTSETSHNVSLTDKTDADPASSIIPGTAQNQKLFGQEMVYSKSCSPKRRNSTGSDNKLKSPQNSQNLKNKKVSEIFKEVKRRGRKRGPKPKTTTLVARKVSKKSKATELAMKVKKRLGKGRSSNFVLLMKEWEKLRSEGAVAEVGKRRRVNLPLVEKPEQKRVLRQRSSLNQKISLDLDDFMNIPDSDLEYNEPKKTKQSISSDTTKESNEESAECSQTLPLVLKSGSKEDAAETFQKAKRKSGSQLKNKSFVTELQIKETIEGVLKMAMEERGDYTETHKQSEVTKKVNADDNHLGKETSNNMDESIFDVSVGTASIFKRLSMEDLYQNITSESNVNLLKEINLSEPLIKKKRGRPKGWKKYPTAIDNPKNILEDNVTSVKSTKAEDVKKTKPPQANEEKSTHEVSPTSLSTCSSKTVSSNSFDVNSQNKINPPNVDDDVSGKFKEIKTKQQLMDDYLIFKKYMAKKSLESVKKDAEAKSTVPTSNEVDKEVKISLVETNKQGLVSDKPVPKRSAEEISQDHHETVKSSYFEEGPSSPGSTSSKDDLALSVLRDRAIKKKKKKLKLKKMMKMKRLEIVDGKLCKLTKPKLPAKDKNKLKKIIKKMPKRGISTKVKVGVSRNCWEVSNVENKTQPLTVVCDDYSSKTHEVETQSALYAHKLQSFLGHHENNKKPSVEVEEETDPMKYCKSIGSIINDLEKRTLNVAKVMHHLKQEEAVKEGDQQTEEKRSTGAEWPSVPQPQQDWNPLPLPLWESGLQTWDADSYSTSCSSSIGSIMDTVNKVTHFKLW